MVGRSPLAPGLAHLHRLPQAQPSQNPNQILNSDFEHFSGPEIAVYSMHTQRLVNLLKVRLQSALSCLDTIQGFLESLYKDDANAIDAESFV